MCCSPKVSKIILVIINVIFILLGLGILIPALLVVINEDAVNDEVFPALQSISFGATNLGDTVKGLAITLIVFGCFVIVLSFIGACGACCEWRPFLVVYMIIVAILFLGKLVIVILWMVMNAEIQDTLKDEMKKGLNKFSEDSITGDETSSGWNYLHMNFQCCGVDVVSSATNDFDTTTWQSGSPGTDIPISCCPGVSSSSYLKGSATSATCTVAKNSNPSGQYSKGCYDALKDVVEKYSIAFIVVGVFILLVEITAIILACMVCKSVGKDQVV